jgi:ABC-type Zn2+ transport system substrate-binding protein/surface adhesin
MMTVVKNDDHDGDDHQHHHDHGEHDDHDEADEPDEHDEHRYLMRVINTMIIMNTWCFTPGIVWGLPSWKWVSRGQDVSLIPQKKED